MYFVWFPCLQAQQKIKFSTFNPIRFILPEITISLHTVLTVKIYFFTKLIRLWKKYVCISLSSFVHIFRYLSDTFFFELIDLKLFLAFFSVSALKKGGYEIVVKSDKLSENVMWKNCCTPSTTVLCSLRPLCSLCL